MTRILVTGHVNIETTLRVDGFPLAYGPVRYPFFGINSTVAGVGYNVAKALHTLGDEVCLFTIVGRDMAGAHVRDALHAQGMATDHVVAGMDTTAQSVILYDQQGRRQIHTDLKDVQSQRYPQAGLRAAAADADLLVLCNINYARPFLSLGRELGIPVATDVHAVADLDDPYNRDFMAHADVLFMSHENLPDAPVDWACAVQERYDPQVLVIGMGAAGALLALRDLPHAIMVEAETVRPVASTVGAGDALFSAFVHTYAATADPLLSLRRAVVFAGHKIGCVGAAEGFATAQELARLCRAKHRA